MADLKWENMARTEAYVDQDEKEVDPRAWERCVDHRLKYSPRRRLKARNGRQNSCIQAFGPLPHG